MIILDTNVVSEPLRRCPDENVLSWLNDQNPQNLALSAITLGELISGVRCLPDGARARHLEYRLRQEILPLFEGRILPFDAESAEIWGNLVATSSKNGHPLPLLDSVIGAICLRHRCALATRNTSDFRFPPGFELVLINPWSHP